MLEDIKQFSIEYFGFNIWKHTRKQEYVDRRKIVYCVIHENVINKPSYTEIGLMGNHDHASYIHNVRTAKNLRKTDRQFRELYDNFCIEFRKQFSIYTNERKTKYEKMQMLINKLWIDRRNLQKKLNIN